MNFTRFLSSVPGLCAVCHGWGRDRVCAQCWGHYAQLSSRCTGCALQVPSGVSLCGSCIVHPPPFDAAFAAVSYAFPWDQLIQQFKFNAHLDLTHSLALLIRNARLQCAAHPLPETLIPIPLSPRRLRERGFNQAWELTRNLSQQMGIPADAHGLLRIQDTPHQLSLPIEQRVANVSLAFSVHPLHRHHYRGRSVALIDDVMTTGATLAAAARKLKLAGAARVEVWAIARTPRPGDNRAPCSTSSWSTPKSPPTRAT